MDARSEVADFYRHELAQALNEQSFGISRSEITHFAENEAEATIALVEGQTINVVLTQEGLYETLDDLLSSTSPAYAARRMEALMERLEGLANKGEE
ncbi:hypothetical protein BJV78DRAFT_1161218 [Lactifluus subvellereus]|nr:hypothetical protein BJV78DRAFT_1161218 [Lactifluus subvellereus]